MPKMNVVFNDKAYSMLEKLQKITGKSKADILRTALSLLAYAEEKKLENGEALALIKGKERKLNKKL